MLFYTLCIFSSSILPSLYDSAFSTFFHTFHSCVWTVIGCWLMFSFHFWMDDRSILLPPFSVSGSISLWFSRSGKFGFSFCLSLLPFLCPSLIWILHMIWFASLLSTDLYFFLPSFQIRIFCLLPLLVTWNLIGTQIPHHPDICFLFPTRHQLINHPPFYTFLTLLLIGFDSTILQRIFSLAFNASMITLQLEWQQESQIPNQVRNFSVYR